MYENENVALLQSALQPQTETEDYGALLNFFANAQASASHILSLALAQEMAINESTLSTTTMLNESDALLIGSNGNANTSETHTDVSIVHTINGSSAKNRAGVEMPKWLIPSYSIILLFAIVGNLLVISTLVQNRRMRTVTNLFLLNLAISDMLLGVLCMPVTLVGTLLRNFIFGEFLCKLIQFSQAASVAVSSWTLVAISCERYYAICHPLRSRSWQTISHAYKIIGFIWFGSILCMTPIAIFSQLIPTSRQGYRKCREHWPDDALIYERFYNILLDLMLLVLPLIILCVAYILITKTLYTGMDAYPLKQYSENGAPYADSTASIGGRSRNSGRRVDGDDIGTDLKVLKIGNNLKLITHVKQCRNALKDNVDAVQRSNYLQNETADNPKANAAIDLRHLPNNKTNDDTTACCNVNQNNLNDRKSEATACVSLEPRTTSQKQNINDMRVKTSPSLRITDAALRRSNEAKTLESKKRVVKMLFVLVLEFFICWTPLYVINTLAIFIGPAMYEYINYSSISFLQLLAYSSSCCNPITYCFMNASFRRAFVDTFKGLPYAGGSATNTTTVGHVTNASVSGVGVNTWPKREATVSISLTGNSGTNNLRL